MFFWEFLQGIFVGGLPYLLTFITNNIFWAFGLFAAGYLMYGKSIKKALLFMPIVTVVILVSFDMGHVLGWTVYTAEFLMILYFMRMTLLIFCSSIPYLEERIPIIWIATFFVSMFYVTFLM
jgi:hypothetical protein